MLGFWNEYSAERTVNDLLKKISLMAVVIRNGVKQEVPVGSLKNKETVLLFPGAIIPADLVIQGCDGLEVDESPLTGESFPVVRKEGDKVFMGTIVTKGSAHGEIIAIGKSTRMGKLSLELANVRPETDFQKGLQKFGSFLMKVIVAMTISIIVVNILLGKPLIDAVIFSLAIAIGLTPELLPVIVTVSLASGARRLAKENVVVRQLVAIEDLGNMDVLCTDKTGTLTEGKISLVSYFSPSYEKDDKIIERALLCNGAIVHHKIIGDPIDTSLWVYARDSNFPPPKGYQEITKEPFDYDRRAMFSVVEKNGEREMIYKGSPQAVMDFCRLVPQKRATLMKKIKSLNESGLRVIAVASKEISMKDKYTFSDAKSLTLLGFITFADNPKHSARGAIEKLLQSGVLVKIVTGDNEVVTKKVCGEIGIECKNLLTGPEISELSEQDLTLKANNCNVFARMTPEQKLRLIKILKGSGHTVGFLGDGINDAPALQAADVGISVNSAVDVAKDAASIVLLKKGLEVIADGVVTGRKIFSNTIKYVLMGTSSNFGNMFSAAGASFMLPFLPMAPSQILLANSLYDVSQLSIPTDNVDQDQLSRPGKWDINLVKKYMLLFGPLSSIYDYLTFGLMYFVFQAKGPLFQTGWFIESLITQILVVFAIRTKVVPFFKSRPSWQLVLTCFGVIGCGAILPFSPIGPLLSFVAPPPLFFGALILMTLTYLGLVEIGKSYLNRHI